jgi:uroporphyrinogen III methyltransferase / synthase
MRGEWIVSKKKREMPLDGREILIMRPREQADELVVMLEELGAHCVAIPAISLSLPEDHLPLMQAIERLRRYQWLVFTSANGVKVFMDHMKNAGCSLESIKVAVIGPGTARMLEASGRIPDLLPDTYTAEGLLMAFDSVDVKGMSILIPRAREARDVLPLGLKMRGATVDVIEAYRTIEEIQESALMRQAIMEGALDAITFTSSSMARSFFRFCEQNALDPPCKTKILCIGPITAGTIRELGRQVHGVARRHTLDGLVELCREML